MENSWPVVRIGDYCSKIGSGATPRGGSNVYQDSGEICLVRSQNIYNNGFKFDGLVYIDEESATKLKNVVLEPNDILLNITGDSVARVCLVDERVLPARVNQHVAIIRPNPSDFDARFLRYYLASPHAQSLLLNLASAGATRNALTKLMIENFEAPKPSIDVQSKIADHLEALELKILSNQDINKTLEQMAQALFKSWFVDFDPVIDNAIATGNDIPDALKHKAEQRKQAQQLSDFKPLPDDIRALFPSEFEQTNEPNIGISGWIPKGWSAGSLSSLANFTSNRIDGTELTRDNYISTDNMLSNKGGVSTASKVPDIKTTPSFKPGDILISNIRPYFQKIWFATFSGGRSNDVLGFEAIDEQCKEYLLNLLYQDVFFDYMMTTSKGSKMPRGDKKAIMDWPVVIPPSSLQKFFSEHVKNYYQVIPMRNKESEALSMLRDTLLPKLISGELPLNKDVE
ncbi:restriction endonuclease subunit S [Pseudoalteromonas sp. G24-MNA-CIBAN-0072]|uniref:restriction endonuclease subunit S n=1 Tax=Pseudoalteromonas sp. G24-MNA-CIBAN-0072 TaxID=3140418 RepID=UPI0033283C59